jgi:hypothetical protein
MIHDEVKLIPTKRATPPIPVGSVKFHAIVTVLRELLRVPKQWCHVVATGEHPERLVEMKEWIAVSLWPEDHPFHWI